MCSVSMIFDHYHDKWTQPMYQNWPQVFPQLPAISQEEIAEFRELLRRAREYDKRTGQPDCEMETKREALKKIAAHLGVDISFPEFEGTQPNANP